MLRPKNGWKRSKESAPGPIKGIDEWHAPGAAKEFPPWVVSAYRIAVKHGFRGTEHEFRMSLLGEDGIYQLPMLLVTDAPEDEIPEGYEAIMRPSSDAYAYYTRKNEFRAADEEIPVPDGLNLTGRVLKLACAGAPFGAGVTLPETELPAVTGSDNGKVMKVVSGEWGAGTL